MFVWLLLNILFFVIFVFRYEVRMRGKVSVRRQWVFVFLIFQFVNLLNTNKYINEPKTKQLKNKQVHKTKGTITISKNKISTNKKDNA